jgi:hypothetical protein
VQSKSRKNQASKEDHLRFQTPDGTSVEDVARVIGRIRRYLNPGNGREFDVTDDRTPEHRLVDPESPGWHVPTGREPHLRKRIGVSVKDVTARDVGRFKVKDFATRATNQHDHKAKLTIHVPEQMLNELTAIVDSKVFPARNMESLARTLIYEGLELLHEIARQDSLYIPNSHMQHLEALATVHRGMMSVLAYDDILETMCGTVRELERRGVRNKARTGVYEMLAIVDRIESGELRRRWRKQIEREFRELMPGRPAQVHTSRRRATGKDEDEE